MTGRVPLAAALLVALAAPTFAQPGPPPLLQSADPTARGPFDVGFGDYKLLAQRDPLIEPDIVTERWARVYFPKPLGASPRPLVVMLHGNHATCGRDFPGFGRIDDNIQYTFTGTCPDGYVVAPSHLGYAYMAEALASHGYLVVSINANRGLGGAEGVPGDDGLNLVRARLVLRHLMTLAAWNRGEAAPAGLNFNPRGAFDFSQIGLMGHSRGGEGMLAAVTLATEAGSPWRARIDPQLAFRSLLAIAPVDGQTERTFTAAGLPWTVLLPTCDGDVSTLEGQVVYDRTIGALAETGRGFPKATFAVQGANHNFFNTEWKIADSSTLNCSPVIFEDFTPGSARQRLTGLYPMMAMMRGAVGPAADAAYLNLFNPAFALPGPLQAAAGFERGYHVAASPSRIMPIDDFRGSARQSSTGAPNVIVNLRAANRFVPEHEGLLRAAFLSWDRAQLARPDLPIYFQSNWTRPGEGRDASAAATLSFRVNQRNVFNTGDSGPKSVSVRLVAADGTLSAPVVVQAPFVLRGSFETYHLTMPTARIALDRFGPFDRTRLRGVRFGFETEESGAVWIANLRLDDQRDADVRATPRVGATPAARVASAGRIAMAAADPTPPRSPIPATANGTDRIVAIRMLATGPSASAVQARTSSPAGAVEIEVAGARAFPVTNALTTLDVGGRRFTRARFAGANGATDRLVFTLDRAQWNALADGAPVSVVTGRDTRPLGTLVKGSLR